MCALSYIPLQKGAHMENEEVERPQTHQGRTVSLKSLCQRILATATTGKAIKITTHSVAYVRSNMYTFAKKHNLRFHYTVIKGEFIVWCDKDEDDNAAQ
jgi:mannose-6-phosphate isomerase-like protein (cupin superfamily)